MSHYRWQENTLILYCHLQPNARHSELAGIHNDSLKIRISAPPVDGKANVAVVNFLSELFAVPKNRVEIIRGHHSRSKVIKIHNPGQLPNDSLIAKRL